ncbi:MAG TPA: ABC transporter permease [Candidatus Dormibacteraeota bacterium]
MTSYLSLELRRSLRDKRYVLITVAWPVAAYLLFSTVFGAAANRAEGLLPVVEIMVAMAAFGAMGGVLLASGPRIAYDRQTGWLRQLSLTPLSKPRILGVRLLTAISLSVPAVMVTFATAALVKGVSLDAWQWAAMAGVLVTGCIPFAVIGLIAGSVSDGDSSQGLTMVVYLLLASLGGLWMPVALLPGPMQTVAHVLPSNHLAQLGWSIARGQVPAAGDVLVLFAWFAGAAAIAWLASRQLSKRA